jgi:hypothetical protein
MRIIKVSCSVILLSAVGIVIAGAYPHVVNCRKTEPFFCANPAPNDPVETQWGQTPAWDCQTHTFSAISDIRVVTSGTLWAVYVATSEDLGTTNSMSGTAHCTYTAYGTCPYYHFSTNSGAWGCASSNRIDTTCYGSTENRPQCD